MRAIYFGTSNGVHNKGTENELYTYRTDEGIEVMCFDLSDEEKKQVAETGKIWLSVHSEGRNINPIMPNLMNPFDNEFVECECGSMELTEYASKVGEGKPMCSRCVAKMTGGNEA